MAKADERKHEKRSVRSARRRAAHYADQERRAQTAVERFRIARYRLTSAVAHSKNQARAARSVLDDVVAHTRELLDQTKLPPTSRRLYEAKLAQSGTERAHLGAALMCLGGAINQLPAAERDRLYDHYAAELRREAIEIEGGR